MGAFMYVIVKSPYGTPIQSNIFNYTSIKNKKIKIKKVFQKFTNYIGEQHVIFWGPATFTVFPKGFLTHGLLCCACRVAQPPGHDWLDWGGYLPPGWPNHSYGVPLVYRVSSCESLTLISL